MFDKFITSAKPSKLFFALFVFELALTIAYLYSSQATIVRCNKLGEK